MSQIQKENQILRDSIQAFKAKMMNAEQMKHQLQKFTDQTQQDLNEFTRKANAEGIEINTKLHELTERYQQTLQSQVSLLTKNRDLSIRKQQQEKQMQECVKLTKQKYEQKIRDFTMKVQQNMRRIQEMSGTNIIKKLLKQERFRSLMAERGIRVDILEKQGELEGINKQVEDYEEEVMAAEAKSALLDLEMAKKRELILSSKALLDSLIRQKDNIMEQNKLLKTKLAQSMVVIEKLIKSESLKIAPQLQEEQEEQQQGQQDQKGEFEEDEQYAQDFEEMSEQEKVE